MSKAEQIRNYAIGEFEKSGQKWFVELHLKVVEKLALELAKKEHADEEVVKLGVWLHDIYYAESEPVSAEKGDDRHDVIGAERARKILTEYACDEKVIRQVEECVLAHRCRDKKPDTLEGKVLASADAMSHIENFSLLLFLGFVKDKMTVQEVYNWLSRKIDRDWNEKIFFPEARDMVKDKYEQVQSILSGMKKSA